MRMESEGITHRHSSSAISYATLALLCQACMNTGKKENQFDIAAFRMIQLETNQQWYYGRSWCYIHTMPKKMLTETN